VTLVVAVVVVIGLAWNHFAASSLAGGLRVPNRLEVIPRPRVVRLRAMNLGLSSILNPANLPALRHTVVIEAGVIAAVVIIDVNRRISRRVRRAEQLARSRSRDDDGTAQDPDALSVDH
jgi:hypothetical protein